MREIEISEFTAKCADLIEEVRASRQPIRITRQGTPLAEIVPPSPVADRRNFLGTGKDTFDILDNDIVGPIIDFG